MTTKEGSEAARKIIDVVAQWLDENGLDGLYNEGTGCRCCRSDLMPCGQPFVECRGGYMIQRKNGWVIVPDRQRWFMDHPQEAPTP